MIKPLKKLIEFWKIEDEGWGRISLLGFIFYLMFVHYCYYEGINIFFIEDLLDSLVFNIKYHFDSKKLPGYKTYDTYWFSLFIFSSITYILIIKSVMWIKEGFENKIGSSYSLNIEENEKENSIDDKVKSPELDWSDLEEKN